MKNRIFTIMCLTALGGIMANCSLDSQPTTSYSQDTFWYSAKNAESGLNGCYSVLRYLGLYGQYNVWAEDCATPNGYNYDNRQGWNDISKGAQTGATAAFANRWSAAYTGIGRCNMLINKIDVNKEMSAQDIAQYKAQARFLRALYYSFLTTYFYTAPFITDAPDISQKDLPRADRDALIDFMLKELDELAEILPARYSGSDTGKATRGAAMALKARLLLFEASPLLNTTGDEQKWRDAAQAALDVINTGAYTLYQGSYRSLFSEAAENGSECIFDVQAVAEPTGYGFSWDIFARQYDATAPTGNLVDDYRMADGKPRSESIYSSSTGYDNMDPRFAQSIVYPGSVFMGETVIPGGSNSFTVTRTGFICKKFTVYDSGSPTSSERAITENNSPVNYMVLRYADILLMYAEAKNELGELTEDVWNLTVRPIRVRGGFTNTSALTYPGNDQTSLRDIVRYERKVELVFEGHYYNDLRRWKESEKVMDDMAIHNHSGATIELRTFNAERDYWWPVPTTEIDANPNLRPNNPDW